MASLADIRARIAAKEQAKEQKKTEVETDETDVELDVDDEEVLEEEEVETKPSKKATVATKSKTTGKFKFDKSEMTDSVKPVKLKSTTCKQEQVIEMFVDSLSKNGEEASYIKEVLENFCEFTEELIFNQKAVSLFGGTFRLSIQKASIRKVPVREGLFVKFPNDYQEVNFKASRGKVVIKGTMVDDEFVEGNFDKDGEFTPAE